MLYNLFFFSIPNIIMYSKMSGEWWSRQATSKPARPHLKRSGLLAQFPRVAGCFLALARMHCGFDQTPFVQTSLCPLLLHEWNKWVRLKFRQQCICPSTDEWVNKLLYSCAIQYYLVIKRNGLLICSSTWMNLQIITLGKKKEKSQTASSQKKNNVKYMILLI